MPASRYEPLVPLVFGVMVSRREQDTIDTGWHEGGHVVAAWWAGMSVNRFFLTGRVSAPGRHLGRTIVDAAATVALSELENARVRGLQRVAGDAVDKRRGVSDTGMDLVAAGEVYDPRFLRALWREVQIETERHWQAIETVAVALVERRDLGRADLETIRTELGLGERTLRNIDQ